MSSFHPLPLSRPSFANRLQIWSATVVGNFESSANASNTITAVRTPAGVDSNELLKHGRDHYSLSLGGGIGELNGQAFRIGHLGSLNELEVMGMIGGIELAFADQQIGVKPGTGLLACQASFLAANAQKASEPAALAAV